MPLVNVRTSSGACGSQPPFPGNRAAPLLQSSVSPCRQVATTTKIRKPTEVLTGYVKRPGILPQNPAVFLQTSTCLFQRDAGRREHTPAAPGEQYGAQLQSPCSFLSPLPSPLSFETQNTGYVHLLLGLALDLSFFFANTKAEHGQRV